MQDHQVRLRWLRNALDAPLVWFGANLAIYVGLVVLLFVPYVAVELDTPVTVSAVGVNLFLSAPGIFLEMILPTAILVIILWNVRPGKQWRFRLLAAVILLPPVLLARELHFLVYVTSVQLVYSQVMIRSRELGW